jgi:dCMP deaminase
MGGAEMSDPRPTKEQYGMLLVRAAATRATCRKTVDGVGCVLTDTAGRVLATGYNGSVPGAPHCEDIGHLLLDGHCVRTVHAEANAIADAARRGVALDGSIAYMTMRPCKDCLKLLSAAGIFKVVFAEFYKGIHGQDEHPSYIWLLEHSGIAFERMPWDVVDHRGNLVIRAPLEGEHEHTWEIAEPWDQYDARKGVR